MNDLFSRIPMGCSVNSVPTLRAPMPFDSGVMIRAKMKPRDPIPSVPPDADENPDVPLLRSWRAVYLFVLVCFVAVVIALGIFSHVFA